MKYTVFCKEAVLKGDFDKFAGLDSVKKKEALVK